MGGGGSAGDGGAAQMEADRQARVKAAIDKINAIFNGQSVSVPDGPATTYTQGQTYYNADGTPYVAPTKTVQEAVGGMPTAGPVPLAKGNGLFAGAQYDPNHDPALGSWVNQGGDAGATWEPNAGLQRQTTGGDSDMTMGFTRGVQKPDTDAIDKAISSGQLYTGVKSIPGLNRQGLYDEQQQAVTDLNQRDVNRQAVDAERNNRFGLARAGLSGGSADVDSNAELDRLQNEGLMKAVGIGQQAGADLRTADERTRQNLISMAQSGIDTGQMSQMALAGLDANVSNAASAKTGATVGNVFGDLANTYLQNQQLAAFNNGYSPYAKTIGTVSSPRATYGGQVS